MTLSIFKDADSLLPVPMPADSTALPDEIGPCGSVIEIRAMDDDEDDEFVEDEEVVEPETGTPDNFDEFEDFDEEDFDDDFDDDFEEELADDYEIEIEDELSNFEKEDGEPNLDEDEFD